MKPFKLNYWKECYYSNERIELLYGMTKATIFKDGSMTISGGTIGITFWYHLINEAMAIYIYYGHNHTNEHTAKIS